MRAKKNPSKDSAEKTVEAIRRAARRRYAAEEKIRIVLQGLRGEESIAELCRREQINRSCKKFRVLSRSSSFKLSAQNGLRTGSRTAPWQHAIPWAVFSTSP